MMLVMTKSMLWYISAKSCQSCDGDDWVDAMYGFTVGQKSWDQHPIIDIKVDIEGHELDALPEWIESGALEKVKSWSSLFFLLQYFPIFRWTSWPWSFILQKYTFSKGGCVLKEVFFSSSIFETWTWIPLFKTCPVWVLVCISCFRFNWMLKLLQKLYTMGFRLISHEVNSAVNLIMHHICLVMICCDILD